MMDLLLAEARRRALPLRPDHLPPLEAYYRELAAWNEKFNLTAMTGYDDVQIKHFLDSLMCLRVVHCAAASVIDVGTGAGFPGIPLKIVCPSLRLTLLESVRKKAEFLKHVAGMLALDNVKVVWGRAEDVGRDPAHRAKYDYALARAVADLPVLTEYALPFCKVGGTFLAQKGANIADELGRAQRAMDTLGGRLRDVVAYDLPGLDQPRHLVVVAKVAPTPKAYPRRAGLPTKQPL